MEKIVQQLRLAHHIILTTHRNCDGDGLGAELGLFHSLQQMGKDVRIVHVDGTPEKYNFLQVGKWIQNFELDQTLPEKIDLVLIFDTNDVRLIEPLYSKLSERCDFVAFVDHHPVLTKGPFPTKLSWIDTAAASTGEMSYRLIRELHSPITRDVARAIYTSITFDTQLFRYIRNSSLSHRIAAEMIEMGVDSDEVHRHLFGSQSAKKVAFLAKALADIHYYCHGRMGLILLKEKDLKEHQLGLEDSRDVIDHLMNIDQVEVGVVFRQEGAEKYRLSLRSKGLVPVLPAAEEVGGGGHLYAAGALAQGKFENLRDQMVDILTEQIEKRALTGS
jgi:phosphoesterase RecJ-like protein